MLSGWFDGGGEKGGDEYPGKDGEGTWGTMLSGSRGAGGKGKGRGRIVSTLCFLYYLLSFSFLVISWRGWKGWRRRMCVESMFWGLGLCNDFDMMWFLSWKGLMARVGGDNSGLWIVESGSGEWGGLYGSCGSLYLLL